MNNRILARIVLIGVLMLNTEASSVFAKGETAYQTGFVRWRGADNGFASWELSGVTGNGGALELDLNSAVTETDPYPAGGYNGHNYYNGGSFQVGEAIGPVISAGFNYQEAIASWNASTPSGTWVEVQFRAGYGTRWSKWYSLGIWASDNTTIERHSVNLQGDSDGYVAVDTFVSTNKKEATNAFQLKLRLFSASESGAVPSVQNASVTYSTSAPKSGSVSENDPDVENVILDLPACSQMVYPEGGPVWCSPTSTSMVLGFWGYMPGICEPRVRAAVDGVYDWLYDGHGNWPFNTAYAASLGYEAYVVRFTSLASLEKYVAAGIPVIMSIAWGKGDLTNPSIDSTNGHLLVLVGFDEAGNAVVNDPAGATDADVNRIYLRSEFEPLWLQASGGTVYLIYPPEHSVPTIP